MFRPNKVIQIASSNSICAFATKNSFADKHFSDYIWCPVALWALVSPDNEIKGIVLNDEMSGEMDFAEDMVGFMGYFNSVEEIEEDDMKLRISVLNELLDEKEREQN